MDPLASFTPTTVGQTRHSQVHGVSVCRLSEEEILESSVLTGRGVTVETTTRQDEPLDNSLSDLRMGPCTGNHLCSTCGDGIEDCPGHPGHIKFAQPLFHPNSFKALADCLDVVCDKCSRPIIDPFDTRDHVVESLTNMPYEKRWDEYVRQCRRRRQDDYICGVPYDRRHDVDYIAKLLLDTESPICGTRACFWKSENVGFLVSHFKLVVTDLEAPAPVQQMQQLAGNVLGITGGNDVFVGHEIGAGKVEKRKAKKKANKGVEENEKGTNPNSKNGMERERSGGRKFRYRITAIPEPLVQVSAAQIYDILKYVLTTEWEKMGFGQKGYDCVTKRWGERWSAHRGHDLLVTSMVIPPPCIRPCSSYGTSEQAKGENPLTQLLKVLVAANNIAYKELEEKGYISQAASDELQSALYKIIKDEPKRKQRQASSVNEASAAAVQEYILEAQRTGKPISEAEIATLTQQTLQKQQKQQKTTKFRRKKEAKASINHRLRGKQGRFRGNLNAGRPTMSTRTVIGCSVHQGIDEVFCPRIIAMIMTKVVSVNQYNVKQITALCANGPFKYPGALRVFYPTCPNALLALKQKEHLLNTNSDRGGGGEGDDQRPITKQPFYDLEHVDYRELLDPATGLLPIGVHVERHVLDGDTGIFNRPPSLHRFSTLGKKIRIHDAKTLRMHIVTAAGHHADNDGDEMSLATNQSPMADAETALMNVEACLIDGKNQAPMYGLIQDMILGAHLLSKPSRMLSKVDISTLIYEAGGDIFNKKECPFGNASRTFEKRWIPMHADALTGDHANPSSDIYEKKWSGLEFLSLLLPKISTTVLGKNPESVETHQGDHYCGAGLEADGGGLVVYDGIIQSGYLSKSSVGACMTSLIKRIEEAYCAKIAVEWVERMSRLCSRAATIFGYTIGIQDFDFGGGSVMTEMQEIIDGEREAVEPYARRLYEEYIKTQDRSYLDQCKKEMDSTVAFATNRIKALGKDFENSNNIVSCISLGARASMANMVNMSCIGGAQAPGGEMLTQGSVNRLFPHFKRFDYAPISFGFNGNSLRQGFTPHEAFTHTAASRFGLTEMGPGTSKGGYLSRRIRQNMSGTTSTFTYGLVQADKLVEIVAGSDGMDCQMLTHVNLSRWIWKPDSFFEDSWNKSCKQARSRIRQRLLMQNPQGLTRHVVLPFNPFLVIHSIRHSSGDAVSRFTDKDQEERVWLEWFDGTLRKRIGEITRGIASISLLMDVCMIAFRPFALYTYNCNLDILVEECCNRYRRALIPPHEPEGMKAAGSLMEPSQQLSLDSFRQQGVTRSGGLVRITNLANCRPEACPYMTVHLKHPFSSSISLANAFAESLPYTHVGKFERKHLYLEHTLTSILASSSSSSSSSCKDTTDATVIDALSKKRPDPVLVIFLNAEECIARNALPLQIVHVLKKELGPALAIYTHPAWLEMATPGTINDVKSLVWDPTNPAYSDSGCNDYYLDVCNENMELENDPWQIRIHTRFYHPYREDMNIYLYLEQIYKRNQDLANRNAGNKNEDGPVDKEKDDDGDGEFKLVSQFQLHEMVYTERFFMRHVLRRILGIVWGGIDGIEDAHVEELTYLQEDTTDGPTQGCMIEKKEYCVITKGANMSTILACNCVDGTRTRCSDTLITEKCLGIYGALTFFAREYTAVLSTVTYIDPRHSLLLGCIQCVLGKALTTTRSGMRQRIKSTLNQASFENPLERILDQSTGAPAEEIQGCADATILGVPIPLGTGAVNLRIDREKMSRMLLSHHEKKKQNVK
jgi:DNA-directed RNA polymerase beta' subunit